MINLISNALKFSKAFDKIRVKLGVTNADSSGFVTLKIEV